MKMCSIPGLPTPYKEVSVLITRVNLTPSGLVFLWAYIDDGRKPVYEQMRKDIQNPKQRFCKSEGKPGDLCLVQKEDETWHRARIKSIHRQNYNVFLIDEGHDHITTSSMLAWGQDDFFLLTPEMEYCVLANVQFIENKCSEKDTFLKSLPGKTISGSVQDVLMADRIIVLSIPLVSKHMRQRGFAKKIPSDQFKSLVLSFQRSSKGGGSEASAQKPEDKSSDVDLELEQYFYPELQMGAFESVEVTEMSDARHIFVQLSIFSTELRKLSVQLQQYYEGTLTVVKEQPQACCAPCAAKGTNGKWYRSLLKHDIVTSDGTVEVLHVDNGRSEVVPVCNIRPLHRKFVRMPVVTFRCCLHGVAEEDVEWTVEQVDYLKSVLLHKSVAANFEKLDEPNGIYYVTLYGDCSENINKCFMKMAVCKEAQIKQEHPHPEIYQNGDLSSCTSSVQEDTPDENLVQEYPILLVCDPYKYCTDNIEVGRKEPVWITCSESVHHFYCQLNRNSICYDELSEKIQQLCNQPQHTAHPLMLDTPCFAKYTDNQWHRGQIIATHPNIQVCFVDYGDILVVNKSDILPIPLQASTVQSVPVQAVRLALFEVPEDVPDEVNSWFGYHAVNNFFTISVVAKDHSGKLLVVLYDGSLNVNKEVRERISKVKPKPAGSVHKAQHDPSYSEKHTIVGVSRESCQTEMQETVPPLREMVKPNEVRSSNGMCAEGEVRTDGQSAPSISAPQEHGKQANKQRNIRINDLPPRLIKQGFVMEVFLSHFNSPSSLFVHLQNEENDIYHLEEKLNKPQSCCDTPVEFSDLQIDDLLLAEFPDDNSWYRAAVKHKLEDNIVSVEFIDHGNELAVSCLKTRYLDKTFAVSPRFSIPCSLEGGCNNDVQWDEDAVSGFKKAITENPEKTFACTFIKETGNTWDIVLEDQGITLANTLVQSGPLESDVTQVKCPEANVTICSYKNPNISLRKKEEVFSSSIAAPYYFWCQLANSEELNSVCSLVQEFGHAGQQDVSHSETLEPGSACLALYSEDQLWYRAQVIRKTGNLLYVLFIDYGNESEVDIKDVKSVPPTLMERAPQAFLCSLDGFDESKGTWDDSAVDVFYDRIVDKRLHLTALHVEDNLESGIPQYSVKIELGEMDVNKLMESYWKVSSTDDAELAAVSHPESGLASSWGPRHG